VPEVQVIEKVVPVPVTKNRQVPMVQTVQRTVEVPEVQYIDKVVDIPVERQRQVPMVQTVQKNQRDSRGAVHRQGGRRPRGEAATSADGADGDQAG